MGKILSEKKQNELSNKIQDIPCFIERETKQRGLTPVYNAERKEWSFLNTKRRKEDF